MMRSSALANRSASSYTRTSSIPKSSTTENTDTNKMIVEKVVDQASKFNLEALIDSMTALYNDIDLPALKRNGKIVKFISAYEPTIKAAMRERTKLSDFDQLKLLGQGAFGEVKLVRHKQTKSVYAMKTLNKKFMVRKWLAESSANFMEERQILLNGAYCPWVIQLHYAFQDKRNLYMVMEFMAGGDLVKLMERYELPDAWLRFYAMEIILGIEAIHNMGFLHRDIKPDNILLDKTGHIKLADFGTCLKMDNRKLVRFERAVGTPDYVPPEMLAAEGRMADYGSESDWWSFGVVLYELIVGDVPFYSESLAGTYSNILAHSKTLRFPPRDEVPMTDNAEDFIRLFIKDKTERFGRNCDCSSIKSHKWFTQANDAWTWDNIREHSAVVIPELKSEIDTQYFDELEPNTDRLNYDDSFGEVTEFQGSQLPFIGFSYKTIPGYDELCKVGRDIGGKASRKNSSAGKPTIPPKPETDEALTKLKSQHDTLRADNRSLQKQLEEQQNQSLTLKTQIAAQKREHEIQLKSLEAQWKRNNTLTINNGPTGQISAVDRQEILALKRELQDIQDKLFKVEAEKRKESERVATLQRDKDSEKSQKEAQADKLAKTKTNIQGLQRKVEDVETQLIEKNEKCKVAERQLRAAEQNIHTLKTQLVEEHGSFVRLREEKDIMLKNQADELKMLKITLEESEKLKLEKEKERQKLEQQVQDLRKTRIPFTPPSDSVTELERKLTETIRALGLKKSELDCASRKFEDQQNLLYRKEREIEELKRQRHRDENIRRDLKTSIAEKEQKIAQLATDYDQKTQEYNALGKDHKDAVDAVGQAKKQLREQQGQMRELTDQLDAEHYFLTLYKSQIRELESDKTEWERQKGDLEAEMKAMKEESVHVAEQIHNKENLLHENDNRYKELVLLSDKLTSDLDIRKQSAADLDQKYQNTVSKVEQLIDEKNILQQEITNIKQEYDKSQEQFEESRAEMAGKLKQETLMKTQAINKLTEIMQRKSDQADSQMRGGGGRNNKKDNKKDKELQHLQREYYMLQADFDNSRVSMESKLDDLTRQLEEERRKFTEVSRTLEHSQKQLQTGQGLPNGNAGSQGSDLTPPRDGQAPYPEQQAHVPIHHQTTPIKSERQQQQSSHQPYIVTGNIDRSVQQLTQNRQAQKYRARRYCRRISYMRLRVRKQSKIEDRMKLESSKEAVHRKLHRQSSSSL